MSVDNDPVPASLGSFPDSAMQIDTPKWTKPPASGRHNYLLYTIYQRHVQSKLEYQVMQLLGLPCSQAYAEEDGDYIPPRTLFGRLLGFFESDLDYYLFCDHYDSIWQQWNTTVEVRYLQISVSELEQELPICALIQKQQPGCNRAVLAYVRKLFACTQAIPYIGQTSMARVLQHWKPLWSAAYLVSLDNQDSQSQALAMAAKQYVHRRLLPLLVYCCMVEGNLPLLCALMRLVYQQTQNGLEHLCFKPFLWVAQLAAHGHMEFLAQWWDTLTDMSTMPLFVMAGVVNRQCLLDQLVVLAKAHGLGVAANILCRSWGEGRDTARCMDFRRPLHPESVDDDEGMVLDQGHFHVRLSVTRSPSLSGTRVGGAMATGSVHSLRWAKNRRGIQFQ
ncbi:hypothetical protein H4R34_000004 [Dimargaris verticillata]|uniref:Uncharacterized protein n=1 Tax=Dimargaris verticillata TaxID=2761393 RepID=A0A9W8EG93_9FUNG|nr:hypothetical protein H4R34_000004 [Dimargaris verticillata]